MVARAKLWSAVDQMRNASLKKFFPCILPLLCFALSNVCALGETPEFRGLWVDAFHDGFKTPQQVNRLLRDVRSGNFNAIVVEIRRRGDVYYNSAMEPKAEEVDSGLDPLADLIAKAHDTTKGPRIEVHAWIVAYPVWNKLEANPRQTNHPFLLHRDWLTKDVKGELWDGSNYAFDPAIPEVQEYLSCLAMEIISKYDVDGFQLDHIRYDSNSWGYHEIALKRFHERFDRKDRPEPTDAEWMQFRRDQVTALVRRIYLSAISAKPQIKISTACNSRAPGIRTTSEWPKSAAWSNTLQSWREWLEEGIVDIAMPMTYFRHEKWASAWENWSIFEKDHRYNRHVVMGPGPYMNTLSNALVQLRSIRVPTSAGNRADGMCLYCYGALSVEKIPRQQFFEALTQPGNTNAGSEPLFATSVPTPRMPWKSAPALGYLKGTLLTADEKLPLDGTVVMLVGPTTRKLITDANGFYGAVDLPPGTYSLTVHCSNTETKISRCSIEAGKVTTCDLLLKKASEPDAKSARTAWGEAKK